jgi:hypothetical protein
MMVGAVLLKVQGQPDRILKAGESFQVPANAPRDGCAVPGEVFKVLGTYIVEKVSRWRHPRRNGTARRSGSLQRVGTVAAPSPSRKAV